MACRALAAGAAGGWAAWWPAGPRYLPATSALCGHALARCSRASLSGTRCLEGPEPEGIRGSVLSGGGRRGTVRVLEGMQSGGGEILQEPTSRGFLWLCRLHPSLSPDPDPGGSGPRGTPRGVAPGLHISAVGKGGRGCKRREFRLHALPLGSKAGDWSRAAVSEAGAGGVSLPEAAGSKALFSLEVKGQRSR